VVVYASLSDRGNVSGTAMGQAWKRLIEPTLPANVEVVYGGSPVGHVYAALGAADAEGSGDSFTVYSDADDISTNYRTLGRYAPELVERGQVHLKAVDRSSTVDVSGTEMRSWLAAGERARFIAHLPTQVDGGALWQLLRSSAPAQATRGRSKQKVEAVDSLRTLVKLALRG